MTDHPTCATCRFQNNGLCKRNPPQMIGVASLEFGATIYHPQPVFPYVAFHDWCGEHREIER